MTDYLPQAADIRTAFSMAIAATAMVWSGRSLAGRRVAPEICLLAGWGALCLVLTAWAVALPFTLYVPMVGCFLFALAGCRYQGQVEGGLWRLALLTVPLWLVMLPARPSQVDTWLNLLPNQAFLVDHALLPRDGGPPSHSLLPAAPYNTQFAAFGASLVSGGLAANAMGLFNIVLLGAAALKLARVAAGRDGVDDPLPLPWWACAAGLLLAVPLNPGFVPRIFLAGYGEAPLAVALMFAVSLSADLLMAERRGSSVRTLAKSLALVLVALVNIKQSSPGLLLPLGACLLGLGLACPDIARLRWCALVTASLAPALIVYLAWRWFVLRHFEMGELEMLPVADWHLAYLPRILGSVLHAMAGHVLFLGLAAVLALAVREQRQRPWQRGTVVLALAGGLVLLFPLFLLFTYVTHFPLSWAVHAHSYVRYMSQLSLVAILALLPVVRQPAVGWLAQRSRTFKRRLATAAIGGVLLLPFAAASALRFDLAMPQPLIWAFAHRAEPYLASGQTLALVMPGDLDDAVGSMLRGVLLFTPPRQRLSFRTELTADDAALDDAASAGATRALVTCSGAGLGGLPPGTAGLLARDGGHWHPVAVWPYDRPLTIHFSAMMPHAPFCGADAPPTL